MSYARRMFLLMAFDAVIVTISILASYYLRFEGNIPYQYSSVILHVLPLAIAIQFVSLYSIQVVQEVLAVRQRRRAHIHY